MTPIQHFMEYWPVISVAIGYVVISIVWGIRLEGMVKLAQRTAEAQLAEATARCNAVDARANDRHDEMMRLISNHYATKDEVSKVKGLVDTLGPQISDVKGAVTRIENKVDAFLVAALNHPGLVK